MNNSMPKTTQFISNFNDGKRTTVQFFPHLMQIWVIVRDNSGHLMSRSETGPMSRETWDFAYSAYDSHPSFTKHTG
jgi:hypothetical protein